MPGLSRTAAVRVLLASSILGSWALASLAPPGAAAGAPTALTASAPPLGGVNIAGLNYGSSLLGADQTIASSRRLHAKLVRVSLPWSVFEPLAPGQPDPNALAFTDRLLADAAADGIGVILGVDSPPCWASAAPAPLLRACLTSRGSAANSWPPRRPSDYAAFVGYLARRYTAGLAAIEIWNEPDQINQAYFAGPEKPKRYAAILAAAYAAIKRANPRVSVLAGSLVGSNGVFLRALYSAGIKGHYDGLAVHFYNQPLASLRALHETQLAAGDHKPLWLDEFGWSSCYPRQSLQEEQACVTLPIQARNLADVFRSLAGARYVRAVVSYDLQDSGSEQFGVLTSSGAAKPSFATLSEALLRPFAAVSRVSLGLRVRGARVVASGSGPPGDYMQLEVLDSRRALRYRPLFLLDRFNRFSIALPSVLGTRGLLVRVYQRWAGIGKGAQRSI